MPRKYRIILALLVAALFIGIHSLKGTRQDAVTTARPSSRPTAGEPAKLRRLGSLTFQPCTLRGGNGMKGIPAQCTTLQMAEDRSHPAGRMIPVRVAWIPLSEEGEQHADPLFFIAGGPGQSAIETYPQLAPIMEGVLQQRDILLVDQRGTGGSNKLACDEADDGSDDSSPGRMKALMRCLDALSKQADLRFYGTTDAIADIDAVRQAIGAQQINLYGVSYGTRVAQQYAMRYPAATRSLVLDSVVPNTLKLSGIFARNLDDSLALQFAVCTGQPECKAVYGSPRAELDTVLKTLDTAPPQVTFRDPRSGQQKVEALTGDEVRGLVRMFAYHPMAAAMLPLQIHEAAQGRYSGLKALTAMLRTTLKDAMAMGMQFSVICSEDAQASGSADDAAGTVLGNRIGEEMRQACAMWPKGQVPADFHQPLSSRVPTLVLEGAFDPVTPPKYGEEVVRSLPNGRLLVLKGQGHNVIAAGCMPRLFTRFIESADAKALDTRCLDALSPAPTFIDFNGGTP